MLSVFKALTLLTPYDIDKPKVRLGPKADGGYVFVDDISPDQPVMSYGISTQYEFDRQMAERGHQVYMFDHTIDGIEQPHENMHFFKQGIGPRTDPENLLYSLGDHIAMNGITSDRIILKMDVEGAEWGALQEVDDGVLERIEQIIIELHGLMKLFNRPWRRRFMDVMSKLNRHFTIFHAHSNNVFGRDFVHLVDGMPVANWLELSLVKSSTVRRVPSRTVYPTELDHPNNEGPDQLLWFYPFMPIGVGVDALNASFELSKTTAA